MKKFLNYFSAEPRALELRADYHLGGQLPSIKLKEKFWVRADFVNLAGLSAPDDSYIDSLVAFCQQCRSEFIHAGFAAFEHRGVYFFNPVPPVLSPKLLRLATNRVKLLQDKIGLPFAIRNVYEPAFNLPTYMPEADFFSELVKNTQSQFVCDLRAVRSYALSFGEDVRDHVRTMLGIDKSLALISDQDDLNLVRELSFTGKTLSPDKGLEGIDILCEGDFGE